MEEAGPPSDTLIHRSEPVKRLQHVTSCFVGCRPGGRRVADLRKLRGPYARGAPQSTIFAQLIGFRQAQALKICSAHALRARTVSVSKTPSPGLRSISTRSRVYISSYRDRPRSTTVHGLTVRPAELSVRSERATEMIREPRIVQSRRAEPERRRAARRPRREARVEPKAPPPCSAQAGPRRPKLGTGRSERMARRAARGRGAAAAPGRARVPPRQRLRKRAEVSPEHRRTDCVAQVYAIGLRAWGRSSKPTRVARAGGRTAERPPSPRLPAR